MSGTTSAQAGSWRAVVLDHFSAEIASSCQMTVVADPDGLLLDDAVGAELATLGFDVAPYRDAIEFRYYYETRHRKRWDAGQHSSLVVSAPFPGDSLGRVPDDILAGADRQGRVIEMSLARIFPTLANDVLSDLDRADLDAVWGAISTSGKDTLGRTQTQDLVLRAVFKLSAEMVTVEEDLLAQLLRLHHRDRVVPGSLAARFAHSVSEQITFAEWPIKELIDSRDSFYEFLQERWPRHLVTVDASIECPPLRLPGPDRINFSAPEIATVVDNLFMDGRLRPVSVPDSSRFSDRWEQVGIAGASASGSIEGVRRLLGTIVSTLPEPNVPPTVWTGFAHRWADLVQMVDGLAAPDYASIRCELESAQRDVDQRLIDWLRSRFGSLVNRSFLPTPTMVHQIAHFLAHRQGSGDKIALVVVDGMSMSQWRMIKDVADHSWKQDVILKEHAVFAWIPTITSISRQAIFSGLAPMFFEASIQSTSAEAKHWKAFWEDRGWRRDRVALVKHRNGEPERDLIARAREVIDNDQVQCIGIVMSSIDRLVHGAGPERNVFNASVRQWAENGHIVELVNVLLDRGFTVALTSDHGNVQVDGIGRPNIGAIPDERGQRAIVFPDSNTMGSVHQEFPCTVPWTGAGLPESMHVLLADGRGAFVNAAGSLRTHGGACIEEVLVPFIQVSKSG